MATAIFTMNAFAINLFVANLFAANLFAYYLDSERYEETLRSKENKQSLVLMRSYRVRKGKKLCDNRFWQIGNGARCRK